MNAADEEEASDASELDFTPPNFLRPLFTDAETETCEQPRSATDSEMPTIRTHQIPNVIRENMLSVEVESDVTRNEERRGQPEWLARLADGLDVLAEDEEKCESPYFVAAALIREVSSEDESRQARDIDERYVPQKSKQKPASVTIVNVELQDSVENESESNEEETAKGNEPLRNPNEHPRIQSFCTNGVSQNSEKNGLVRDQLTFNGESARGVQDDLTVSNYRHEFLNLPRSSFEADTDNSRTSRIPAKVNPAPDIDSHIEIVRKEDDTYDNGLTDLYCNADGIRWTSRNDAHTDIADTGQGDGEDGNTMDRDIFWAIDNESNNETTMGEVRVDGHSEAASQRYAEISNKKSERTFGNSGVTLMTDEKGSIRSETEDETSLSATRRNACLAPAISCRIGNHRSWSSEEVRRYVTGRERSPPMFLRQTRKKFTESVQQEDSTSNSPLAACDHQP